MTNLFQIREATVQDLEELSELFNQYLEFYGKNRKPEKANNFLLSNIENHHSKIFVAQKNQQLLGFIQLYPSWSSLQMGRVWIINDLFVQAASRQLGVGQALMRKGIEFAKRHDAVYVELETSKENFIAQQLYRKLGFMIEHETYYLSLNFGEEE
ncbi:GNAT family N-acetyltransferase [Acinetobacter baumannii]|uniref:GNAT family N-acetyltransferase n=1 Tax=Acinetobacter baumannii TaxID=470 RepID=UPI000445E28B|nr:GNAT family N-acetyltransferase [Acinetobacter baumannii]EXE39461.1 acetyltransferase family protein [Acinetobacter baumannii 1546444]MCT9288822.1 GNAT family N-acetyltransferase [Acinetobacter baumannii]MCV2390437.1 GNAT family N-acetyltransferase [Acinetobacter baumannii]MDC4272776.1 GNAT family N-acetyltransferase [Acinetobacter baumannii]MDC4583454.1 GNAT family N-acetyltransferase [Acinetobacter baumannii]